MILETDVLLEAGGAYRGVARIIEGDAAFECHTARVYRTRRSALARAKAVGDQYRNNTLKAGDAYLVGIYFTKRAKG